MYLPLAFEGASKLLRGLPTDSSVVKPNIFEVILVRTQNILTYECVVYSNLTKIEINRPKN